MSNICTTVMVLDKYKMDIRLDDILHTYIKK